MNWKFWKNRKEFDWSKLPLLREQDFYRFAHLSNGDAVEFPLQLARQVASQVQARLMRGECRTDDERTLAIGEMRGLQEFMNVYNSILDGTYWKRIDYER